MCAAGIGGPPAILYLLSAPDRVPVTRANLTLYVALISVASLAMLEARGILNATALESTLLLAALYPIGVLLGGRLFRRFPTGASDNSPSCCCWPCKLS